VVAVAQLASGLSGSAALLGWLVRLRKDARGRAGAFASSERFFLFLELVLIVALVVTLIPAGTLGRAFGFPWILLWLVAVVSLVPWFRSRERVRPAATGDGAVARDGAVAARRAIAAPGLLLTLLALVSVLAIRAAVIFSAQ